MFKQEMPRDMYIVSYTKFLFAMRAEPHGIRESCLHHAAGWDVRLPALLICRAVLQHGDILWSASGGDERLYKDKVRKQANIKM